MGLFKRKKNRKAEYTATQMYNDHTASLAMFALMQPTAIVDPVEQQREADEKYDAEHPVDNTSVEQEPVQESYSGYDSPDYSSSDSGYDSSSYSSYDSGSSYDSSSSSSYDSGGSFDSGSF